MLTYAGHSDKINKLCLIEGDQKFASIGNDYLIKVWEFGQEIEVYTLSAHTGFIQSIVCLDKETLITGGDDKLICIWQLSEKSGNLLRKIDLMKTSAKIIIKLNCDLFASGMEDGSIRIWRK